VVAFSGSAFPPPFLKADCFTANGLSPIAYTIRRITPPDVPNELRISDAVLLLSERLSFGRRAALLSIE
jgi:hypothetical protein